MDVVELTELRHSNRRHYRLGEIQFCVMHSATRKSWHLYEQVGKDWLSRHIKSWGYTRPREWDDIEPVAFPFMPDYITRQTMKALQEL